MVNEQKINELMDGELKDILQKLVCDELCPSEWNAIVLTYNMKTRKAIIVIENHVLQEDSTDHWWNDTKGLERSVDRMEEAANTVFKSVKPSGPGQVITKDTGKAGWFGDNYVSGYIARPFVVEW